MSRDPGLAAPGILFVIGASGAGKTAAVAALAARALPGVACYHFDSIGVPTPEIMERDWGGGEHWQRHATEQWIERLASNLDGVDVAVLEGQTRPSFIQPRLARREVRRARILLLDCAPSVRTARLRGPRGQPELASDRMQQWAVYLRGQADSLGLPVFDTSDLTVSRVADVLQREVEILHGSRD